MDSASLSSHELSRGRESEVVDEWETFRRPIAFKSRVL